MLEIPPSGSSSSAWAGSLDPRAAAQDVGEHDRRNDFDASPARIVEELAASSGIDRHARSCRDDRDLFPGLR